MTKQLKVRLRRERTVTREIAEETIFPREQVKVFCSENEDVWRGLRLLFTEKKLAKYWLKQSFVSSDQKLRIVARLARWETEIRALLTEYPGVRRAYCTRQRRANNLGWVSKRHRLVERLFVNSNFIAE